MNLTLTSNLIRLYNLLVAMEDGLSGGWGNDPNHIKTDFEREEFKKAILLELLSHKVTIRPNSSGMLQKYKD